jgi:hypothetical protein
MNKIEITWRFEDKNGQIAEQTIETNDLGLTSSVAQMLLTINELRKLDGLLSVKKFTVNGNDHPECEWSKHPDKEILVMQKGMRYTRWPYWHGIQWMPDWYSSCTTCFIECNCYRLSPYSGGSDESI